MSTLFNCSVDAPVVATTKGPVRGYTFKGINIFKGIPYGRAKRFHAPEPTETWENVFDATSFGCVCPLMNMDKPMGELMVPHRFWIQDEDCLNLNIWAPQEDADNLPVMVWLHGGGFFAGSSIEHICYEGENMAREGKCVVVSLNHRLNILGYMDLSDFGPEYANSGNAGGDDIILALKWVHDNIASFGGNPDNVTLFGQSGGGCKITALLQSPAADGLYHRGIIMSGVVGATANLPDSIGSGRKCVEAIMSELGVATAAELETVPYASLAAAYNKVAPALKKAGENVGMTPHPNEFYLGDPMTNEIGFRPETKHIPLVVGTVFSEFMGFFEKVASLTPAELFDKDTADRLTELFAQAYPDKNPNRVLALDTTFRGATVPYIQKRAADGSTVYSYLFAQDFPLLGTRGAWHCADIPFVFHNTELSPVCNFEGSKELEAKIFDAVMSFATTSTPGWEACTKDTENTMIIDQSWHMVQNHDHELLKVLAPLTGQIMAAGIGDGQLQH